MRTGAVVLLLVGAGVSGCSWEATIRGQGVPASDRDRYAFLFTPSHYFECENKGGIGKLTVQAYPGDVYGAVDMGGQEYTLYATNLRSAYADRPTAEFPANVVGLHIEQGFHFTIFPDGRFAMEQYPLVVANTEWTVIYTDYNYQCTNNKDIPPFKRIDPS